MAKTNDISLQAIDVIQMYNNFRYWSIGMVVWGGISIVFWDIVDPAWGIILIIVGVLSWWLKIPAMLVIISVIITGSALMNAISAITGEGSRFLVAGLFQVFWGIVSIRQYNKYKKLPLQQMYKDGIWLEDLAPPQK